MMIFLAFVVSSFFTKPLSYKKYRSLNIAQLIQLTPLKKEYLITDLRFNWEKIPNTIHYSIEIFDSTLYPIWKREKILLNQIDTLQELIKELDEGQTYFWMVTAFLSNGDKIESQLEKFTIKK